MAKRVWPLLPNMARVLVEMGENIKYARLRRRISATLIAERAGLTRVTLKKIERGESSVTLGAYAHVLNSLGFGEDLRKVARDDELGRKLQDAGLKDPRGTFKKR